MKVKDLSKGFFFTFTFPFFEFGQSNIHIFRQILKHSVRFRLWHLLKKKFSFFPGSDGVWDAMINQDMISFVRQRLQSHSNRRDKLILSQLCEQILDMCCAKTVGRYGKNSCDNMTIIIIWFDHSKNRHHPTHHHHPHHPGSETGSSVVSSCVSRWIKMKKKYRRTSYILNRWECCLQLLNM